MNEHAWITESNKIAIEESKWKDEDIIHEDLTYEDGKLDDFIAIYLKPIFLNPKSTMGSPDTKIEIISESVGDLMSMKNCHEYLKMTYPLKTFTNRDVKRCYNIISLAIRKTNHVEAMTDHCTDVCWIHYYTNHGTFTYSRRKELEYIFKAKLLLFPCYDVDQEFFVGSCPIHKERPSFTLKELMEDDIKCRTFYNFWSNAGDFEPTYHILRALFPKEIVIKIVCMTVSDIPQA
jgi:hypothetical protein